MFVWIGCQLPEGFSEQLRSCCRENAPCGLDFSGFTLPQHISLKISFDAGERSGQILDAVEALLRGESAFSVIPRRICREGRILWVEFVENAALRQLHDLLDRELEGRFGVQQHMFDRNFRFHSTLCMGAEEALELLNARLADFPLPGELPVSTFLLGLSESGKSGTYRVVRTVKV